MSEQEHESKSEKFIYMGVGVACFIGAIIVGRLVGFLGIGAIALGWVAFTFSRDKVGIFLGILVGGVAGLAAYGLAAVALMDLLR